MHELKTRVAHPYDIDKVPDGSRQICVDGPLRALHDSSPAGAACRDTSFGCSRLLPADAFCVIGVTMEDLFEGRDDSFVMGMAAYATTSARC